MDSNAFVISLMLLVTLVIAVVLWLDWQNRKSLRDSAPEKAFTQALTLMAQQQAEVLSRIGKSAQEMLSSTVSELGRAQMASLRASEETTSRAMSGASSTVMSFQKTLDTLIVMLGTKDPIAYQQVRLAQPMGTDGDDGPYTASDEYALAEAVRLDKMRQDLIEGLGGQDGAADSEPAGAGHGAFAFDGEG